MAGPYLGFPGILVTALAAFGASILLSPSAHFDLLPLLHGLRAACQVWRGEDDEAPAGEGGPSLLAVDGVTFANGGDNIGVKVTAGNARLALYAALVAVLCAAGKFLAGSRRPGHGPLEHIRLA